MARGQHEAIAIGPRRVGRVVAEVAAPQREPQARRPHRHTGVAGVRLLHGIDGEKLNGLGGETSQVVVDRSRHRVTLFVSGLWESRQFNSARPQRWVETLPSRALARGRRTDRSTPRSPAASRAQRSSSLLPVSNAATARIASTSVVAGQSDPTWACQPRSRQ